MKGPLAPRFLPDRRAHLEWGGKGAPLARMIRAGFAVPPTSCFGLSSVRAWVEGFAEHGAALREWAPWTEGAPEALERLREAILGAPAPADWPRVGGLLRASLAGDQLWPMILRSSMSAEDGAEESFAGCFDSVRVEVPTDHALWKAFREVVSSAFTEEAARRALAAGLKPEDFRAAVVVQPYLQAELAGVCFSRDPADPWNADGCAEWVRGAGELLVQGTGEASRRRRSEGPAPGTEAFWDALWKRAEQAEKIVGGPADLEWVWDGAQLWFVQARPIATEEARLAARGSRRRWSRALTLERFPEPVSPMGWSVLEDTLAGNLETLDRRFGVVAKRPEEMAVSVRGVVYSDPEFFSFPSGVRIRWLRYLAPWRATIWKALGALARFAGRAVARRPRAASRALLKLELAEAVLASQARQISSSWGHHRDTGLERIESFEREIAGAALSEPELLARMEELRGIGRVFMEPDLAVYLIKDATQQALFGLWKALGLPEAGFVDLFRSFEGNRTMEMNREWSRLIEAIAVDSSQAFFLERLAGARDLAAGLEAGAALSAPAAEAWRSFLGRNGHSTSSWDIAAPTWSDDPSRLLPLLSSSVKAGALRAPAAGAAQAPAREETRRRLFGALDLSVVRRAVDTVETFMRIDEEHHFLSGRLLMPSRRLVLESAAILARKGVIESADEVFFLRIEELKDALAEPAPRTLRFLARRRRAEWERARQGEPAFELPAAQAPAASPASAGSGGDGALQGLPMSPGVATGVIRVAERIEDTRELEPGTILVTTSPNPALTPIYPLLAGLVTVTGSSLSHGFVSAREYGLPAVSGISGATRQLRDGLRVRVDGTTGRIELLQEEGA